MRASLGSGEGRGVRRKGVALFFDQMKAKVAEHPGGGLKERMGRCNASLDLRV